MRHLLNVSVGLSVLFSIACGATSAVPDEDATASNPIMTDSGPEADATCDDCTDTTRPPEPAPYALEAIILDGNGNTPLAGVTIDLRQCPQCAAKEGEIRTATDGTFRIGADAKEDLLPLDNAMAIELTLSKAGYQSRTVYILPRFKDSASVAKLETLELYSTDEPDSDGDGLADALEEKLGLDPENGDTDADGIPDDYEVNGCNWLDYRDLGAKPTMRDLLIEVDYQHYYRDGVLRSARLSDALIQRATTFWASQPVHTPLPGGNSTSGIAVHFVHDSELTQDFSCYYSGADKEKSGMGDHSPSNKLFGKTFHKATICITSGSGFKGNNHISGAGLRMTSPNTNNDPTDDWTEKAQLVRLAVMTHELGHSLGLLHGGAQDINFKPNYPSLMNYAFDTSFDGAPQTLQDTKMRFSSGKLPDLDESALLEVAPFPGVPASELNYLKYYKNKKSKATLKNIVGDFCEAGGGDLCLDWNNDGMFSPDPQPFIITGGTNPRILKDHNDFKTIENKMAKPLTALPNCMLQYPKN